MNPKKFPMPTGMLLKPTTKKNSFRFKIQLPIKTSPSS